MKVHPAIKDLATDVFDNGRRGAPKPGCDCLQCFGYCMVDQDAYSREMALRSEGRGQGIPSTALEVLE